jgi:hypothetical protein
MSFTSCNSLGLEENKAGKGVRGTGKGQLQEGKARNNSRS